MRRYPAEMAWWQNCCQILSTLMMTPWSASENEKFGEKTKIPTRLDKNTDKWMKMER
jgi:hypothetical protein